jgi:ABC-type Fe3+-citrate transport system substrate-binding protein
MSKKANDAKARMRKAIGVRLKAFKKLPEVKREIAELKHHFKKDKWDLSFTYIQECLVRSGVPSYYAASLVVTAGYRIVYAAASMDLVVRK